MRKQSFEPFKCFRIIKILASFRIVKILEDVSLDNTLTSLISKHRMRPSHTSVESVIALTMIFNNRNIVTAKSGILSPIFVNYVKDVLQLLKVIIFVSECNIEMVSKAERALLPKFTTFAYSNFSSSQVCFLGSLSNMERISVERSCWKKMVPEAP